MSLNPAAYNFTIWRNTTFRKRLTVRQGGEGSAVRDITGWSARLVIKDPQTDTVLLTLTSPTDIVLGGAAGTVDIIIDDAVTAALPWTNASYALYLTDTSGEPDIWLRGSFHVKG